jgi:hypothetical protein
MPTIRTELAALGCVATILGAAATASAAEQPHPRSLSLREGEGGRYVARIARQLPQRAPL